MYRVTMNLNITEQEWSQFKGKCYGEGYTLSDKLTALIKTVLQRKLTKGDN